MSYSRSTHNDAKLVYAFICAGLLVPLDVRSGSNFRHIPSRGICTVSMWTVEFSFFKVSQIWMINNGRLKTVDD